MSLSGISAYGYLPNITGNADADFNDITAQNVSIGDKLLFEQADANDEGNMTTYIFQDPTTNDLVVNNNNPLGGFKIQWGNTPDTSILSFRIDPYNQKLEYPVGNDPEESITFGELNALKGIDTNVSIQQQIDTIVDITAGGGYWGTFFSDIDQFLASANTPTIATLNGYDAENDGLALYGSVGLGNYNSVKVLNKATYNIQMSFQFSSTSSSTTQFRAWFRVNGTDIANSSAGVSTHNNNGYDILTFNVIMPLDIDDILTLMWASNATTQHLEALPAQISPYTCPSSPSVYLSFQQVTGYQDNSVIVDDLATRVSGLEYKTQDQTYSNLTLTTTFANALTAGNTVASRVGVGKPVSNSYAIDVSGNVNITGTYQINGVPILSGFVYGTVSSGTILTAGSPNLIGLIHSGTDYTVYLPGVLTIPQGKIYQFFPKSPFPAGGVVYISGRTSTQLILINGVVEEYVEFTEQIQSLTFVCISNTASSTVPCWAILINEYFSDEYLRGTAGITNNINSTNNFYGNSEFFGYATFSRSEGDSVALNINGGSYLKIEGGLLVEGVGISPLELSHLSGTVENIQTHFDNLVYSYMGLGGSNESTATNYFYQTQTFARTDDEGYGIVLVAGSKLVLDGELYVNSILISPTELSRLTGVSSNIQTQINNLVSAGSGYMLLAGSNSVPANNTYTGQNNFNRTAGDAVALTVSGGSKLSLLGSLLVANTTISPTELSRLTGISSNIQTQINNLISMGSTYMLLAGENSSTANNTYTGINTFSRTTGDTTALLITSGSVLRLDGNLYVSGTVITPLELSRLDGITYNIQDQINAITTAPATNLAGGGPSKLVYQTALNTTGFIENGTAGQLLKSNGSSAPSWVDSQGLTQILQKSNIGSGINIYSGPVSATRTDGVSNVATVNTNSSTMLFDGKIGFGETDFVNMHGSGEGGFYFYSTNSNTVNYNTPIAYISRTGNITAPTFFGALSGNATSATSATSATTATNITISTIGSDLEYYPIFADDITGNRPPYVDGGLKYNPFLNTLTTTTFAGSLTGNANSATNTNITAVADDLEYYPTFVGATSGNNAQLVDVGLKYNPGQNILIASTFRGALDGTAGKATNIAGGAASKLVYQTATNTTGFIDNGTAGQLLKSNGSSAPSWVNSPGLTEVLTTGNNAGGLNAYLGPVSSTRIDGVSVSATIPYQSSTMMWDGKGGNGETDFINQCGTGAGGFNFYSTLATTVNYNAPIVTISKFGHITASNFIGPLDGTASTATTASNITVTDISLNNTFYPLFVDASGISKSAYINKTTNPFSINPTIGSINLAKTLKIDNAFIDGFGSKIGIGFESGLISQYESACALGDYAGGINQSVYTAAFGYSAGYVNQAPFASAFGPFSGYTSQGINCCAFGVNAGQDQQQQYAVAFGTGAGFQSQGPSCVAIGDLAGQMYQGGGGGGGSSVAIGQLAGQNYQGPSCVAIGVLAGQNYQGESSVAIGNLAGVGESGVSGIGANSIMINSSGVALNNTKTNALFISPIANNTTDTSNQLLTYNFTTKEVCRQSGIMINGTTNKIMADAIQDIGTRTPSTARNITALGYLSQNTILTGTTTGTDNVGIGTSALSANAAGSFLTAVGSGAGSSHTVGDYCTYVGYNTGKLNTASNTTIIGANSCTTQTSIPNATVVGHNNTITDGVSNAIILGTGCSVGANSGVAIGTGVSNTTANRIHIGAGTSTAFFGGAVIVNNEYVNQAGTVITGTTTIPNNNFYQFYGLKPGVSAFTITLPTAVAVRVGTQISFRRVLGANTTTIITFNCATGSVMFGLNSVAAVASVTLPGFKIDFVCLSDGGTNYGWYVMDQ